ncbi:hypothetical protein H2204_002583 [Knufia peltigerae]|uniref:N,N-dimethylformamidase beta subunit-like C-terminal domain-containing protein n=1 Tax=Knufia peltigerae TaxID=1002370 RepID=A0AA39D2W1_9EURO|nr:hypothetical protein H2204_002583 [Knufia peltigerae]
MTTPTPPTAPHQPEITGYVEPWIAGPGGQVNVKVSSTEPELNYHVVRLVHGPQGRDTSHGQPETVTEIPSGKCRGRYQVAQPGSYAIIAKRDYHLKPTGMNFTIYFQSHLPEAGHVQTIVSSLDILTKTGYAAVLNCDGLLEFWIGTRSTVEVISTGFKAELKRWTELSFTFLDQVFSYEICPKPLFADIAPPSIRCTKTLAQVAEVFEPCVLTFAASFVTSPEKVSVTATNVFNGRLDSPIIKSGSSDSTVRAKWDFSLNTPSDIVVHVSGNMPAAEGRLVNCPTRAVTGHDWDGMESDWTKANYGYGAIHFHDDDLDDAGMATDFSVKLPENLRSGVYAIEVEATNGTARDTIPFFVRPTATTNKALGAKVAYIISTFTYLAYANEHVYDRAHLKDRVGSKYKIIPDAHAEKTVRRNDLGLSCYDLHNDRSGVIYSTSKRPILNMRPDYVSWNFHRPRGLSADLLMVEFLERSGIPYDVVCDLDLHTFGHTCIRRYGTIITGSHPEYHTTESLGAYAAFIKAGGNVMYLGGNGFYWSCATTSENLHRVEIRRGGEGVRPFTCDGGDRIFSSNGQSGLLWRSRGLASNYLFGVGCCAMGPGPGVPYKRTDASKQASLAWMFDGITENELLGEFGFGGGASGDEIDKCDVQNGSPRNTIVVASSTGHPDTFALFPEDIVFPFQNVLGTQTTEVRSDVAYYETSNGGAVFSVGSINWFCSLAWDHFQNNIARLTDNVLREFVRRHK